MFRKLAIVLAATAFVVTTAEVAWAADDDDEGFIGVGARFAWDNYKTPLITYSGMSTEPGRAALDYGGPNLGGAFHWGVTNRLVLTASLDFGYFNHTIYPYPEEGSKDIRSVTASFVQFGAMVGAKFYFKEPEPGGVSLYLSGGVGAYFAAATSTAKVRTARNALKDNFYSHACDGDAMYDYGIECDGDDPDEDVDMDDEWDDWINDDDGGEDPWDDAGDDDRDQQKIIDKELEMVGDLASPFVFQVAIGAEFFANETFSVGADILGLRFAFASSDVGKVKNTDMSTAQWTGEQSYMNLYVYSALTMSFNLTADAGSTPAAGEGEGDEGWGNKEEGGGDGWGSGGGDQGGGGGWGTSTGWSTGPAAPAPATQPAAQPAPAPAPEPAPTPDSGGGGWDSSAPPPPPPPPPPGY